MRKKIAYAVFTTTKSGAEYIVKGNFGKDKSAANDWATFHKNDTGYADELCAGPELPKYPNGLFVKRIEY